MNKLKFYGKTFIGRRSNNEDKYFAGKITEDLFFFAVADGMGGSVSGEVASALVIDKALEVLKEEAPLITSPAELKDTLLRIYLIAQISIKEKITKEPMLNGMGSTLVTLLIYKDTYIYGNLGDCRLYKIDNEKISRLTEDHTYIEDFLKNNDNNLPDSILSKYGNYLMKSIDGGNDEPDIFPKDKPFEVLSNDTIFILCSDGLILDKTSSDDQKIFDIILSDVKLNKTVNKLVYQAYKDGSKDNITVISVEYGNLKRVNNNYSKLNNPDKKRFVINHINKTLLLAVFLVAIVLGYFIYKKYDSSPVKDSQADQSITVDGLSDQTKDFEKTIDTVIKNKSDVRKNTNEIKWYPFLGSTDVSFNFGENLKWKGLPGIKKYKVEISKNNIKVRSIDTEKTLIGLSSLEPGRYKLHMEAHTKDGGKLFFTGFLSIRKK